METKVVQAQELHVPEVVSIVEESIRGTYPDYYPQEIVDFFLKLHDPEHIRQDIQKGNTYLLWDGEQFVATGTISRRRLTRIFVLPGVQKKGYGTAMMEYLEQKAAETYKDAMVESSLPGCIFYEKRGYRTVKHYSTLVDHGRILVYELMQKKLYGGV